MQHVVAAHRPLLIVLCALGLSSHPQTRLASGFLVPPGSIPTPFRATTTPTASRHCDCPAIRNSCDATTTTTTTTARSSITSFSLLRPSSLFMSSSPSHDVLIKKDIVVIGGGLAGLSTALELAKRGRQVTVLSRDRGEAAAEAAGGMIAPQSERLESGPYLDLCLQSRSMYADWVGSVEAIARLGLAQQGEGEGAETATDFWSSGGFLSPAFEGDAVHTWSPPPEGGQAHWVDRDQVSVVFVVDVWFI